LAFKGLANSVATVRLKTGLETETSHVPLSNPATPRSGKSWLIQARFNRNRNFKSTQTDFRHRLEQVSFPSKDKFTPSAVISG
jgi:hypothetical protein